MDCPIKGKYVTADGIFENEYCGTKTFSSGAQSISQVTYSHTCSHFVQLSLHLCYRRCIYVAFRSHEIGTYVSQTDRQTHTHEHMHHAEPSARERQKQIGTPEEAETILASVRASALARKLARRQAGYEDADDETGGIDYEEGTVAGDKT